MSLTWMHGNEVPLCKNGRGTLVCNRLEIDEDTGDISGGGQIVFRRRRSVNVAFPANSLESYAMIDLGLRIIYSWPSSIVMDVDRRGAYHINTRLGAVQWYWESPLLTCNVDKDVGGSWQTSGTLTYYAYAWANSFTTGPFLLRFLPVNATGDGTAYLGYDWYVNWRAPSGGLGQDDGIPFVGPTQLTMTASYTARPIPWGSTYYAYLSLA